MVLLIEENEEKKFIIFRVIICVGLFLIIKFFFMFVIKIYWIDCLEYIYLIIMLLLINVFNNVFIYLYNNYLYDC